MEKKQTAVAWLMGELEKSHVKMNLHDTVVYQQAVEMEKEQIIDAFYQCGKDNFEHIKIINRSAVEYYNETYGKETDRS